MKINIKEFTSALDKVGVFAGGEKKSPGVLLDIQSDHVNVSYSDGRKSVIERVDAEINENDRQEKIVLDYQRLADIVKVCQPTGRVITDYMELLFEGESLLVVRVEKKIAQKVADEGTAEMEMASDEVEEKTEQSDINKRVISVFEQRISWVPAGSGMKVALLTRMNYDTIFAENNEDGTAVEKDEWDIREFRDVLNKTTSENNKVVYVSPKRESAFVSNMAYMSCIPVDEKYEQAMVFSTAISKALLGILGKVVGEDTVNVHILDKKYCCIHTSDNKVGICVEMSDANKIHLTTLGRYQSKKYGNYQLTFIKEALKNIIDAAMEVDKSDKTVLKFEESKVEEGTIDLRVDAGSTISSTSNGFTLSSMECTDPADNITEFELPVSLKVISDIVSKCDTDFIGIDIDVDETGTKFIRISELDPDVRDASESAAREELGIDYGEELPLETKIECRNDILIGKHYTISAK